MLLHPIDWAYIIGYFALTLLIGLIVTKRSSSSVSEFFLSGRSLPWWLLGVSLVATTFSADTPLFITDSLRTNGVAGNWIWWAFALTGMSTVFIYAKLWRRSGVLTDLEFYDIRYSGKGATFLRAFRSLYLGIAINILILASCSLSAIKIGAVMFGFEPIKTLIIAMAVTVVYTGLGGFLGVVLTDCFQFIIKMTGAVYAAWFVLRMPQVGGLSGMLHNKFVVTAFDVPELPQLGHRSYHIHPASNHPVVGCLVSRRGTGRRWLRCPAYACGEVGEAFHRRGPFVQHHSITRSGPGRG